MEIAVVLAAGLQDWIDFGVIIGILMMNAVVGWYQEKWVSSSLSSPNLPGARTQRIGSKLIAL
jgi:H+-transporting ATPase